MKKYFRRVSIEVFYTLTHGFYNYTLCSGPYFLCIIRAEIHTTFNVMTSYRVVECDNT